MIDVNKLTIDDVLEFLRDNVPELEGRLSLGSRVFREQAMLPGMELIGGQCLASAIDSMVTGVPFAYSDVDVFRIDVEGRSDTSGVEDSDDAMIIARKAVDEMKSCPKSMFVGLSVGTTLGYFVKSSQEVDGINLTTVSGKQIEGLKDVVDGFDLNCTMAGCSVETGELYLSPEFKDYLKTRQIHVTRFTTPMCTLARAITKSRELPNSYCNTEAVLEGALLASSVIGGDRYYKERLGEVRWGYLSKALNPEEHGIYFETDGECFTYDKSRSRRSQWAEQLDAYIALHESDELATGTNQLQQLRNSQVLLQETIHLVQDIYDVNAGIVSKKVFNNKVSMLGEYGWLGKLMVLSRLTRQDTLLADTYSKESLLGMDKLLNDHSRLRFGFSKRLASEPLSEVLHDLEVVLRKSKELGDWVVGLLETKAMSFEEVSALTSSVLDEEGYCVRPVLSSGELDCERYEVNELLTSDDFEREGHEMGHCVKGYFYSCTERYRDSKVSELPIYRVLSIKCKQTGQRATMSITDGERLEEVKGPGNERAEIASEDLNKIAQRYIDAIRIEYGQELVVGDLGVDDMMEL